jgi:hypothetical protein
MTFRDAYYSMQVPRTKGLTKIIWRFFIPPARFLITWRLVHNIISTEDNLPKRGFTIVSCCSLCGSSFETTNNLFLQCPFKICATIYAIEFAHSRGWTNFWLECDFLFLVQAFTNMNLIPWKLKVKWNNVL